MSEMKRYKIWVEPDGDDYGYFNSIQKNGNSITESDITITDAKTIVNELNSLEAENDRLKAEVERLRKAGDKMAKDLFVGYWADFEDDPTIKAWNAAKEGKPSV